MPAPKQKVVGAIRAVLSEKIGLMMTGEEPGAGSAWHQRAAAALDIEAEPVDISQLQRYGWSGMGRYPDADYGSYVLYDDLAALVLTPTTPAVADVLAERQRQQKVEGWTAEHDDQYTKGQLSAAAACYALHNEPAGNIGDYLRFWPWLAKWWKPKDERRNLVKAAALLLAEIERIDRIKP